MKNHFLPSVPSHILSQPVKQAPIFPQHRLYSQNLALLYLVLGIFAPIPYLDSWILCLPNPPFDPQRTLRHMRGLFDQLKLHTFNCPVPLLCPIKNGAAFEQGHTLAMLHLIEHLAKVALLLQLTYSINKSSVTPLFLHISTLSFYLPKAMLRILRELSQVLIDRHLLPAYPIHHIQVESSLIRLLSLNVLAIVFSPYMLELSEKLTVRCLQHPSVILSLAKKKPVITNPSS